MGIQAAKYIAKIENLAGRHYHHQYMLVDFSNGASLTRIEYSLPPDVILGLRFIYSYFFCESYSMNYRHFLSTLEKNAIDLGRFTLSNALEAIRMDKGIENEFLLVIFHIDEVQFIFGTEHYYTYERDIILREVEEAKRFNPHQLPPIRVPKGLFKLLM